VLRTKPKRTHCNFGEAFDPGPPALEPC